MSIEQLLTDLNTNIKALTAAMAAGGAVSSASTGTAATDAGTTSTKGTRGKKSDTPAADAKKNDPTREEMVAALTEVKDRFGAAEAKAIISKAGAAKMADIADDKIESVFKLAKSKIEADDADSDDGGDL